MSTPLPVLTEKLASLLLDAVKIAGSHRPDEVLFLIEKT
jgi:hypothetical protein